MSKCLPCVIMASMWRNDSDRRIVDRAEHLLQKAESWPNLRWVWVVGDSSDDTLDVLTQLSTGYDVQIVQRDTGIAGDEPHARLRRLSQTAQAYIEAVRPDDDYVLVHESDIGSPYDLVPRLVAHAEEGSCPIGAWSTLELRPNQWVFYDTWATRADGLRFANNRPYHKRYRADQPFQVDSMGTVFMFQAEDAPYVCMAEQAVLDLCRQLRERGRTLWVDPRLIVEQPRDLWIPYNA